MKAIEFIARAQKGSIKIPSQYLKSLNQEFKVIILIKEKVTKTKPQKPLKAFSVKTKGLAFDRNEANER